MGGGGGGEGGGRIIGLFDPSSLPLSPAATMSCGADSSRRGGGGSVTRAFGAAVATSRAVAAAVAAAAVAGAAAASGLGFGRGGGGTVGFLLGGGGRAFGACPRRRGGGFTPLGFPTRFFGFLVPGLAEERLLGGRDGGAVRGGGGRPGITAAGRGTRDQKGLSSVRQWDQPLHNGSYLSQVVVSHADVRLHPLHGLRSTQAMTFASSAVVLQQTSIGAQVIFSQFRD